MTLMPSLHVRDPRRRYRANQIRKRVRTSVPPPVVFDISDDLVEGLVRIPTTARTQALLRIEKDRGADYVTEVIRRLAIRLREKRKS